MKKTTVNARDVARNAGATVGGAANTELGVFEVNTKVSITSKPNSYSQQRMLEELRTVNRGNRGRRASESYCAVRLRARPYGYMSSKIIYSRQWGPA